MSFFERILRIDIDNPTKPPFDKGGLEMFDVETRQQRPQSSPFRGWVAITLALFYKKNPYLWSGLF